MEKIEIHNDLVTVTVKSELYYVTEGSISAKILIDENRKTIALGDGCDYTFTKQDIEFIKSNIGKTVSIEISSGNKQLDLKSIPVEYDEDEVLRNIGRMIPDGKKLILPENVFFDNYNDVKTYLTKNLGKYKNNAFEFPISAKIMQERILNGEIKNLKKELQFFGTPAAVCEELTNQIIGMLGPGYTMLEPSAGQGAIVQALQTVRPDIKITALEYSDVNYSVLTDKFESNSDVTTLQGDFLKHTPETLGQFNLIIANPPFTGGQDIQHIRHMYKFLKPGGQLITMSSPSPITNNQKKYQEFKEWAENEGGLYFPVSKGAFKESGTNVETYIWVFHAEGDRNPSVARDFQKPELEEVKNMWGF
jgi:ubiquinone/menaquinone biosynthesis C-methylase UbiE